MEILEFCADKLRSLGLKNDAGQFLLHWEKSTGTSIEVKGGRVENLNKSTDEGLSIRTLRDGRMGFSYTFDLSKDAVEKAVRTALDIGELMPIDPLNGLPAFEEARYPAVEAYDGAGLDAALDEKIALAKELEAATLRFDARIKRVRKAGFGQSACETALMDTRGRVLRHRATFFAAYATCVAELDDSAEMGSDARHANFYRRLEHALVAPEAAQNALKLLGARPARTMSCPAVFKNSVVAQLLGFLSASFSAENVDKNFSLLSGKIGRKIFSGEIRISDDALLKDGIASAPFDAEGSPSRPTELVSGGVLNTYLYDRYYARKAGAVTTASSRTGSLKAPPSIGVSNFFLVPGPAGLEALFREAGSGVYITDVMGLHTANAITGEFSLGASGLLIENGRLTTPVKGFAIAGNLLDLMNRVEAVGADSRFFGPIGAPSLLFSEISVGGGRA